MSSTSISDSSWLLVHADVRACSEAIVDAGKYDDAVFSAYRLVEAILQERTGSRSIGQVLIAEAFDGETPKVNISNDKRDAEAIRQLFSGALGHIRNDRGHKRVPSIPCTTSKTCFQFLSTASLLIFYLEQDRSLWPAVEGVRLFGSQTTPSLEIRGSHLDRVTAVFAGETASQTTIHSSNLIEANLTEGFQGFIRLILPNGDDLKVPCDARALSERPESVYEVIAVDIPLFTDSKCTRRHEHVVGLLLRVQEAGARIFNRIQPTIAGKYQIGQYVTHGPFSQKSVGETWYLEPTTGMPLSAWQGSLIGEPIVLGMAGERKYISIRILPNEIRVEPGESRCVRVRGFYIDGPASGEADVTQEVSWEVERGQVAHIKSGALHAKAFGNSKLEAKWKGQISTASIRVNAIVRGTVTQFFQGFRRLQQIAFDGKDNLFFVNQSESVYCVDQKGRFSEVARLEMDNSEVYGIDCLHITSDDIIYLSTVSGHQCLRLRRKGECYGDPERVAASVSGVKKGVASHSDGTVYVAIMGDISGGQIMKISQNGDELVFKTPDMAIYLAVGLDGRLYVPSNRTNSIHVFSSEGALLEEISHGYSDSASGISIGKDGSIYVAFFYSGKLVRITRSENSTTCDLIADGFGTPGGIALDSKGRIFVSDFSGDSIRMVA